MIEILCAMINLIIKKNQLLLIFQTLIEILIVVQIITDFQILGKEVHRLLAHLGIIDVHNQVSYFIILNLIIFI